MPEFELVEHNLREAMKAYAYATPEGSVRELPGLSLVSSGLSLAVFNSAMLASALSGTEHEMEQRFLLAGVHFAAKGLPWSFWLCEEMLASELRKRARRFFADQGFRVVHEPSGMHAERLTPRRGAAARLEYRPVCDEATRLAFCDVTSIVFDLPFPTSMQIYGNESIWKAPVYGFVAYLGGKPVSTLMLVEAAGAFGVYSVGTLPQHQRRGYAESLLRYGLGWMAERYGPRPAVLQSTRAGFRLYEKLGFRLVAKITVYVSR